MVKGVAVKFKSYEETLPKLLELIKFSEELKKHNKIILKPNLINGDSENSTKAEFVEPILSFIMKNKNPGTGVLIAEGCDGHDTYEVFDKLGYTKLSEKYGIGLIDLNKAEIEEIENPDFQRFETIMYPSILLSSFIISLPKLTPHKEIGLSGSLDNMLGAFPQKHYKSFFSKSKDKLKKFPIQYQIYDILKCKMPNFAIIDASQKGIILAGQPLEMEKQATKIYKLNWQNLPHLRMVEESLAQSPKVDKKVSELIGEA